MNRVPGPLPLISMYASRAETGHNGLLVLTTYISTPWWKGSVLDAFILTCLVCGFARLSTCTSFTDRWGPSSKAFSAGMHTFPECKNPKKHKNSAPTAWLYPCLETPFPTPLSYSGVIGSLGECCFPFFAWFDFMPFNTCSNFAIEPIPGSPTPCAI